MIVLLIIWLIDDCLINYLVDRWLSYSLFGWSMDLFILLDAFREAQSQNKDFSRQVQELISIRVQLEADRDRLSAELSDAQDGLGEAQTRLEAITNTLTQIKIDFEHRLRSKDEEIETMRSVLDKTVEWLFLSAQLSFNPLAAVGLFLSAQLSVNPLAVVGLFLTAQLSVNSLAVVGLFLYSIKI